MPSKKHELQGACLYAAWGAFVRVYVLQRDTYVLPYGLQRDTFVRVILLLTNTHMIVQS